MRKESELTTEEFKKITEQLDFLYDKNGFLKRAGIEHQYPKVKPEERALIEKLTIYAPFLLDSQEHDLCGHLFAKHVMGLELPKEVNDWWGKVYWKKEMKVDSASFWQAMGQSFPELITDKEAQWLAYNDPIGGNAFSFLCDLYFLGNIGHHSILVQQIVQSAPK